MRRILMVAILGFLAFGSALSSLVEDKEFAELYIRSKEQAIQESYERYHRADSSRSLIYGWNPEIFRRLKIGAQQQGTDISQYFVAQVTLGEKCSETVALPGNFVVVIFDKPGECLIERDYKVDEGYHIYQRDRAGGIFNFIPGPGSGGTVTVTVIRLGADHYRKARPFLP